MREFVYLSEAKLAQFVPEPRRFPWRLKSINTPFGGAEVEPGAAPGIAERLHEVESHVAKQARWYTEEGLRPGEWVQFDAPLNHSVLSDDDFGLEMAVFADTASDDPVRLLLHGSAAHLVDSPRRSSPSPSGSAQRAVFGLLDEMADGGVSFVIGTMDPIEWLDRLAGPATAIWMRGYARITVVVSRLKDVRAVVASPLYVEYTDPPEDAT